MVIINLITFIGTAFAGFDFAFIIITITFRVFAVALSNFTISYYQS